MPQPQNIENALNRLNDMNSPLDQINVEVIHYVQRSELFSYLQTLSILLESQVLNQAQTLTLCYILAQHAPMQMNPFFPVLKRQYKKMDDFNRKFIELVLLNKCPSEVCYERKES